MAARISEEEWQRIGRDFQVGGLAKPVGVRRKRSKYNAKAVIVTDLGMVHAEPIAREKGITGRRFDSRHEGLRYVTLMGMQQRGLITRLECQPVYPICARNGTKVAEYRADFRYLTAAGDVVVEDAKGMRTPIYRLKKKLVEAEHGIAIQEV